MIRDGERMAEILLVISAVTLGSFVTQDDAENADAVADAAQVSSEFGDPDRRLQNLDEVDSHSAMWTWSDQFIDNVRAVSKGLIDTEHSEKPRTRSC